jgi:hypothetical protein
MEPVVAAANLEMGYGLSGVRLPPVVPSRVGVEVLVKHLSATGADAVKRHKSDDDWFTNNLHAWGFQSRQSREPPKLPESSAVLV